ncbi:hypothetical protein KFK09_000553 [Dendrobium nobile]|uniref:Uncharacterized protein n=1 Tax=Dendrobium nobile TaxID=94219 RepID=A0A8T3C8W4_DENNO|nr:hypothetical protein KFK09_000553 [Dendrobium nobile]
MGSRGMKRRLGGARVGYDIRNGRAIVGVSRGLSYRVGGDEVKEVVNRRANEEGHGGSVFNDVEEKRSRLCEQESRNGTECTVIRWDFR